MTSFPDRLHRRLALTAAVLRHGAAALPPCSPTTGYAPAGAGGNGVDRGDRGDRDEPPALPGRHQAFVDAGVGLPRTARRRRPRALTTDLAAWERFAAAVGTPERPAGLPPQLDALPADDPTLTLATGRYRAMLVGPGASEQLIRSAALGGTPMFAAATTTLPDSVRDLVTTVSDVGDLRAGLLPLLVQDELFDRASLQLRRRATRRFAATDTERHLVSAVVPTNRAHQLDHVLANAGRQRHPSELVLVLHGIVVDEADVRRRAREAGVRRLRLVAADASATLGACMNLGVAAASGSYVAKMDDDNHYGAEFLGDLVDAAACSGADIVGKWAHLVWLRSTGAVVLRYPDAENTFERRVQGGAMLFRRDVVRTLGFSDIPRAVDSDILDRAIAQGHPIYSADRFNYVSVREADAGRHTWKVGDETFLTRAGTLVFYGDPTEHASV